MFQWWKIAFIWNLVTPNDWVCMIQMTSSSDVVEKLWQKRPQETGIKIINNFLKNQLTKLFILSIWEVTGLRNVNCAFSLAIRARQQHNAQCALNEVIAVSVYTIKDQQVWNMFYCISLLSFFTLVYGR